MATILRNEPLWNKTTFKIGGPADKLVFPEAYELTEWMRSNEAPMILGGGANLLIADSGIRGTTLSLERGFRDIRIERPGGGKVTVRVQAGAGLTRLAGILVKESVAGFEFACGIPGLVGGALIMNAGTGGGEMKDVIESVTVITADGVEKTLSGDECGFSYRSSGFPEGCVITEAVMSLREGDSHAISEEMKRVQRERKAKQPLEFPSAGSVYKNPPGDFAGRLIEEAGMKEVSVGDAQVSARHANFIINRGRARAADVLRLMELIEKKVYESSGVALEREIRLMGDFGGKTNV